MQAGEARRAVHDQREAARRESSPGLMRARPDATRRSCHRTGPRSMRREPNGHAAPLSSSSPTATRILNEPARRHSAERRTAAPATTITGSPRSLLRFAQSGTRRANARTVACRRSQSRGSAGCLGDVDGAFSVARPSIPSVRLGLPARVKLEDHGGPGHIGLVCSVGPHPEDVIDTELGVPRLRRR